MAIFAYTSAYLSLTGPGDISSLVKSVTITVNGEELDATTMGSSGWKAIVGGLKSWSLSVEFLDDFADSGLDDDLWAVFNTSNAIEFRPTSASVGTGNPKFTGSVWISQHTVGGGVGTLAGKTVTWNGNGALTRAEA